VNISVYREAVAPLTMASYKTHTNPGTPLEDPHQEAQPL
jgi:hypothetical protein